MSRFVGGKTPAGYSGSGPVKQPSSGGGRDKPVKDTTRTRGSQPGKPAPAKPPGKPAFTKPTRGSQPGKPAPAKPPGKPAFTKPTRGSGNKGTGGSSSGPGKGIK